MGVCGGAMDDIWYEELPSQRSQRGPPGLLLLLLATLLLLQLLLLLLVTTRTALQAKHRVTKNVKHKMSLFCYNKKLQKLRLNTDRT